ncbi:hypothetical protein PHLGIDRAFT_448949 [Phlebiopsis gigantea 11061_1 CR5-6]|uniref:F-box domain-containing protein n=1 Tax=Phlebiopsis gigantea (strain 11061_1 CR5-6) TaxID=745531 RepID=A0A0C3SA36_PHLG1|nr:hypothetical protein PHLGIDRAFT_448949 [Phlebiopsis gigantea 11061_1 CR5-6]
MFHHLHPQGILVMIEGFEERSLSCNMLTDLPLELLERIVDRLRPAKWPSCSAQEDIKSVSLVCRRFRHTGQSYLFRDVVYTFRYAPMDAQWEADASLQPWNPEWERRGVSDLWLTQSTTKISSSPIMATASISETRMLWISLIGVVSWPVPLSWRIWR